MAKLGEKYEAVVVFSLKNGEEQVQNLVAKFSDLIKENAELVNVDEWGKRKLAYPIEDLTEGYYVLVNFESDANFPAELERRFSINENIMRSIVIRHEEKKTAKADA